jgi:hypothetical protein
LIGRYAGSVHHGVVPKFAAFAAAWLAAAAVAVVVAWQGVGIVTNQVTDDRPAPLAADEVRALTDEARARDTADDAAPAPAGTATVLSPTSAGPVGSTPTPTPTPTTSQAPGGSPAAPATSPTTAAPATAGPTTTEPTAPAAETRTYNLVGGSAALRFSPSGVTVVWATPAAGFEVEVEPEHVNGVRVEFESDGHRSRVTGWWDRGPRDETREDRR